MINTVTREKLVECLRSNATFTGPIEDYRFVALHKFKLKLLTAVARELLNEELPNEPTREDWDGLLTVKSAK